MSDAKAIVEAAVFATLSANIKGAKVFQDAPYEQPNPLVLIGDMRSSRLPVKGGDDDRRVSISIVTLVDADERAPLLDLQRQIEALLDAKTLTPNGWLLQFEFQDDTAVLADDDTYVGVTDFSVLAIAP